MKTYNGFDSLLNDINSLPETGWVFVDKKIKSDSEASICEATFFIAESEEEEIDLERGKQALLECPTLVDIVSVLKKRPTNPSSQEYLGAVIYYRKYDDFQE